jgi:WXG100 family type VII secretion target
VPEIPGQGRVGDEEEPVAQEPVSVDTTVMVNAGNEFVSVHDQISSKVVNLQNEIETLFGSWSGESAVIFNKSMEPFYNDANKVLNNLMQIASGVQQAAVEYDKTHHLTMDSATQLGQRITADSAGLPGF